MINTVMGRRVPELNVEFLEQGQFNQLSPQQRKWAKNQFRVIYAEQEQMSKFTLQLEHQKRIKNNLVTIQKEKQQENKQAFIKLKQKMEGYGKKRRQKNQQKLKIYQLNEEKWGRKIQQIQSKFRHQNRSAIEKAEKLRQQSQDYWKNKETQMMTVRETSTHKFKMNKTQKTLIRKQAGKLLNHSNHQDKRALSQRTKYLQFKVGTLALDSSVKINSQNSRTLVKSSRVIDINEQIIRHKQRSDRLQRQKQMSVFQNAMQKLARIQLTRRKGQKLKQSSKSPVQIRRPKGQQDQNNFYNVNPGNRKSYSIQDTKSKQSVLNESIKSHIKAKILLQEQQFKQRQKIVENEQKRKRQDKIVKAIKNKIKDLKSSVIKIQTSQ